MRAERVEGEVDDAEQQRHADPRAAVRAQVDADPLQVHHPERVPEPTDEAVRAALAGLGLHDPVDGVRVLGLLLVLLEGLLPDQPRVLVAVLGLQQPVEVVREHGAAEAEPRRADLQLREPAARRHPLRSSREGSP